MKISSALLRLILLAAFCIAAAESLLAQGNDNPTGVAGAFNPGSNTGCPYDPYTGNATRTIPDIVVSGAVGAYPLVWARTMNSRGSNASNLGDGGGWRYSYQWSCVAANDSMSSTASSYTISYPDGRVITFSGTPFIGPVGVRDRVGVSPTGDAVTLNLPDGGAVVFPQTIIHTGNEYELRMSPPNKILDPSGQQTSLTYDGSNRLTQVTEPALRWLKIYYNGDNTISHVDASYPSGPIPVPQSVTYGYTRRTFGGVSYNTLTSATYNDGTAAAYTYQAANNSASDNPLISTCADVRYPGPMKNITYTFLAGASRGRLATIKDTGAAGLVLTLTINSGIRTELRGDGPSRTWTYGATAAPYLLKTYTDFLGNSASLGYDTRGLVNSSTDFNGHTTNFVNHAWSGAVTKVTHPGDGSFIQYSYEPNGYHLQSMTDELGHLTTYKLNASPAFTPFEIDYPDGGIEGYSYNGYNQVLTHTMPSNTAANGSGGTEHFIYDTGNRGLLWKSYPPDTPSDPNASLHPTVYTYDTNDHPKTITDPLGHQTTVTYNERGQLTDQQNPDPNHSHKTFAYNDDGTLDHAADELGHVTSYTYDDYKRLLTVTRPLRFTGDNAPRVSHFWYDSAGAGVNQYTHTDSNVTLAVSPEGRTVKTTYDNNFRKVTMVAGGNATTTYSYDQGGNLKTMKDANANSADPNHPNTGLIWSYDYDARDRLIDLDDPLTADRNSAGHTVSYTYDAMNKKSEQRANDQIINYNTYDAMNRLLQMTTFQTPSPVAVTHYTWTKAGKIDSMTDPRGNIYSYDYDLLNRVVTSTFPPDGNGAVKTETKIYDFAGNLASFKNRGGNTENLTYDARNRQLTAQWDNGNPQDRTWGYDDASRLTSCYTTNTFINFVYNNDNSLASQEEWGSLGTNYGDGTHRTISYAYDGDGNRASVTYPGLGSPSFLYDYTSREQLKSMTWTYDSSKVVSYLYDPNGNPTSRTPGTNLASIYGYDAVNRVTDITHNFTNVGAKTYHYTYDAMGNRQTTRRDGGVTDTLGYDQNNQMTTFSLGGTATSLTYDANGNRKQVGATTYATVNGLNQYTTVGTANVGYGTNGNLNSYNTWSYGYDSMNHLTTASKTGTSSGFYYDGLGRQVARTINGVTTYSLWDGANRVAEYGSGGTLLNRWIYAGGDLVRSPNPQLMPTAVLTYYYTDGLGSTSHIADASGNLLERYTYDLAGTPSAYAPGSVVPLSGSAYGIDMLFTGQKWYPDLGLYDLRARAYLPSLGRFLQPDPIGFGGDASNIYRYCGNNPMNLGDPSGLGTFTLGGGDGAGALISIGRNGGQWSFSIHVGVGEGVFGSYSWADSGSQTSGVDLSLRATYGYGAVAALQTNSNTGTDGTYGSVEGSVLTYTQGFNTDGTPTTPSVGAGGGGAAGGGISVRLNKPLSQALDALVNRYLQLSRDLGPSLLWVSPSLAPNIVASVDAGIAGAISALSAYAAKHGPGIGVVAVNGHAVVVRSFGTISHDGTTYSNGVPVGGLGSTLVSTGGGGWETWGGAGLYGGGASGEGNTVVPYEKE